MWKMKKRTETISDDFLSEKRQSQRELDKLFLVEEFSVERNAAEEWSSIRKNVWRISRGNILTCKIEENSI